MIVYKKGDILGSNAEALVNAVNCAGVMGLGLALQFKRAYPDNAAYYLDACKRGEVRPGRMLVFDTGNLFPPRYIINFPTKRHWRANSRIEDIADGLVDLVRVVQDRQIRSIAIPALGTGLGRLDWEQIRPLMEQAATQMEDVGVQMYVPLAGSPM